MSQDSNKQGRLAAIIFADLVGYTALMQKDEAQGLAKLNHFKSILEDSIPNFNGSIDQYYGDGCLATFSSAVDSVHCAIALQKQFIENSIDVRLGMHSGEVVYSDDNVLGNSVNIASRIESMGVPGGVLVSKQLRDQIKNKQGFLFLSLGSFDFKNVEEPMQVFALTNKGLIVPDKKNLSGKFKSKRRKRSKFLFPLLSIGVLLIAYLVWKSNKTDVLPKEVREGIVAILPLENKTDKPELDVLGDLASDWITRGLMDLEDLKVVSHQNVKDNIKHAAEGAPTEEFKKITGAQTIIYGNYYFLDIKLIISCKIINTDGNFEESIIVEGTEEEMRKLITNLQSTISSYFALKESKVFGDLIQSIPKIESYREFQKAEKLFGKDTDKTIDHLNNAIRLDSNFLFAYLVKINTLTNAGKYQEAESQLEKIKSIFKSLNPSSQIQIDWITAIINRDLEGCKRASLQLAKKDPKNILYNYNTGYYDASLNRPSKAIEVFRLIDTTIVPKLMSSNALTWWTEVYSHCLIKLKQYDEALKILNLAPSEFTNLDNYRLRTQAYINQGKKEKIDELINRVAAISSNLSGDLDKQRFYGNAGVQHLKNQPEGVEVRPFQLAESFYQAGDLNQALNYYLKHKETATSGSVYGKGKWHTISKIGCIFARKNDTSSALKVIEELDQIDDYRPSGRYTYAKARIYAQLGEKEKAISLMKAAMKEGFSNEYGEFRYGEDIEFEPLRGIPEFENFVIQD
jgi:class 3 adenylate cyclase/tetratricopeptide (TPR) repeat protein/TolB-like protein